MLKDAFSTFREQENVKAWHWAWHSDTTLDRRGEGQFCAMMTMQAVMEDSCLRYGLANQDKVHQNFEGFLAWLVKGQCNDEWKMAASNMINFMEALSLLVNSIPYESVPKKIRSVWDIKFMQEVRVTILDELDELNARNVQGGI